MLSRKLRNENCMKGKSRLHYQMDNIIFFQYWSWEIIMTSERTDSGETGVANRSRHEWMEENRVEIKGHYYLRVLSVWWSGLFETMTQCVSQADMSCFILLSGWSANLHHSQLEAFTRGVKGRNQLIGKYSTVPCMCKWICLKILTSRGKSKVWQWNQKTELHVYTLKKTNSF